MDVQLTPEREAELTSLEAPIKTIQGLLKRAERAGLPTQELQARLLEAETRRRGMLREFGSNAKSRRQA